MKEEIQVRISEEELIAKIKEIAQQINEDYVGKKVHLVCILSGSVFFTCELAKYITVPVTMDFMRVSSYGEGMELFLADMHLESSGLARIIKTGYHLLGLISYLTAGPQEVRAWTITRGTKAPQAAGKIHTDFEKGFIRAEIVAFDDLMKCGSMAAAKEKGLVRLEGKDYVMQDGDVTLFRFNV